MIAQNRRILLVEDDDRLSKLLVQTLRGAGYDPTCIDNGTDALDLAEQSFAIALVDLMLPGIHGLDVLKAIRRHSDMPVVVLSARNETKLKVRAFALGADDYLTKPFWPDELLARIQACLRRPTMRRERRLLVGDLTVDLEARLVSLHDEPLTLTRVEFELLAMLARRVGTAITRDDLCEAILDRESREPSRALDVHVSRLRKKLGEHGGCIVTVWGIGYRLDPEPPP